MACIISTTSIIVININFIFFNNKLIRLNRSCLFIDKINKAIPNLKIRHKGFLIGIELQSFDVVKKVIKGAINEGVIVDWYMFSSQTIRVAPPLVISYDELDFAADVLIRQLKNI